MSVTAYFTTVGLVFLIALSGAVAGLLQAWPRGGRVWNWKRARLLIVSAIFLAAVAAIIVIGIIAMWDIDQ